MSELTRETVDAAIERIEAQPSRPAVGYINATLAENERLRAFAAQQNDQLLEANAEIERLRTAIFTLQAQTVDAQGKARAWKKERNDALSRLEIVRDALIEAGMIESEWDGSEEEETR
ncbi:MAG: hypothetical protein KAX65_11625 [Caldilineaceae bacterium]|nr:hypothetical protein [Caldilineaceae bacterium]